MSADANHDTPNPFAKEPAFFIQARRADDGRSFDIEAGWDYLHPSPLACRVGPESRIGRAMSHIENLIAHRRPAARPNAIAPRAKP